MPAERSRAFAPGRVNLIGEHTDYNQGLALPFAIAEGVTVRAGAQPADRPGTRRDQAHALDLGERDEFALAEPPAADAAGARSCAASSPSSRAPASRSPARSWRSAASSARRRAVLLGRARGRAVPRADRARLARDAAAAADARRGSSIARLCARVENDWVGAQTGLLDQLASLYGAPRARAAASTSARSRSSRCRCGSDGWRLVRARLRRAPRARELRLQRAPRRMRRAPASCSACSRCARPARRRSSDCPSRCAAARATCSRRTSACARRSRALRARRLTAVGAPARRLAREPARQLRGLHSGRRGRRRAACATRAPPARASSAAASAAACSACSRPAPSRPRGARGASEPWSASARPVSRGAVPLDEASRHRHGTRRPRLLAAPGVEHERREARLGDAGPTSDRPRIDRGLCIDAGHAQSIGPDASLDCTRSLGRSDRRVRCAVRRRYRAGLETTRGSCCTHPSIDRLRGVRDTDLPRQPLPCWRGGRCDAGLLCARHEGNTGSSTTNRGSPRRVNGSTAYSSIHG